MIHSAMDYVSAARVPDSVPEIEFGPWQIYRQDIFPPIKDEFSAITVLSHITMSTMHRRHGETVMEDSMKELQRHLPIWMKGAGKVLITGLGLGCVVRGLLHNPRVESIDVLEIDPHIVTIVGAEFAKDPRVHIHRRDATKLNWYRGRSWDYAWHDLWMEGDGLQVAHGKMMLELDARVKHQGAWAFPRELKRGFETIG